jgi:hypothetical protein
VNRVQRKSPRWSLSEDIPKFNLVLCLKYPSVAQSGGEEDIIGVPETGFRNSFSSKDPLSVLAIILY